MNEPPESACDKPSNPAPISDDAFKVASIAVQLAKGRAISAEHYERAIAVIEEAQRSLEARLPNASQASQASQKGHQFDDLLREPPKKVTGVARKLGRVHKRDEFLSRIERFFPSRKSVAETARGLTAPPTISLCHQGHIRSAEDIIESEIISDGELRLYQHMDRKDENHIRGNHIRGSVVSDPLTKLSSLAQIITGAENGSSEPPGGS